MVRSTLEYGCLIWDLYTNKNIDKLESIQKRAARFIKHDYKSRERGCVTNMLKDLEFKPLQERRKHIRLTMFYKVVEGLVPAIAPEDYLKEIRNKRKRKAKQYEGFETSNIIDRQIVNNSRPFELIQFKTDTRKNSFFSKTIVDWNHLEDSVVCAKTVEGFNSALQQLDYSNRSPSSASITVIGSCTVNIQTQIQTDHGDQF
jgi:hypothetical protein